MISMSSRFVRELVVAHAVRHVESMLNVRVLMNKSDAVRIVAADLNLTYAEYDKLKSKVSRKK